LFVEPIEKGFLRTFPALLFLLGSLLQAQADGEEDKIYFATRIDQQAPDIGGNFTDGSWQSSSWYNHFIQIEPYEGKEPSQDTRFKIFLRRRLSLCCSESL